MSVYNAEVAATNSAAKNAIEQLKTVYDQDIKANNEELQAQINKVIAANSAAKALIDAKSVGVFKAILDTSSTILSLAKELAIKNIQTTRETMRNLGDELYYGAKQNTVLGYHNALIKSLKGQDAEFEGLKLSGASGKVLPITSQLTDIISGVSLAANLKVMYVDLYSQKITNSNLLLSVPLFDDLLKNVNNTEDDEYFVGATPKIRDFRTPKALPDFNLPPIREYVNFDYTDLINAVGEASKKLKVGSYVEISVPMGHQIVKQKVYKDTSNTPEVSVVNKDTFLSFGGRIPGIWNLMLKDKAFVETDFYLTKSMAPEGVDISDTALSLGGEELALYRGGEYPCKVIDATSCKINGKVENNIGVVDITRASSLTKNSEYSLGFGVLEGDKRTQALANNPPVCQAVRLNCSKSKIRVEITNNNEYSNAWPVILQD